MSRSATREALLDAARAEFAEHGVAGARVDRVAARAGVNKERIYGHFGSKEILFDTIMEIALDEVAAAVAQPGDDQAAYVGALFDHYRAHPDLLRLLMWESLHHRERPLPDQPSRRARARAKIGSLTGGGTGPEADPDGARRLLTLTGLALTPLALPRLVELYGLGDLADDAAAAAVRDHLVAFVGAATADVAESDRPDTP